MTRMLNSGFKTIAVLIALMTALSVPEPFWSRTRRLTMLACGAMPSKVREYLGPVELAPLLPVTKLWFQTTRDNPRKPPFRSGWLLTPLSISAMPTPAPVYPDCHAAKAFTAGAALLRVGV